MYVSMYVFMYLRMYVYMYVWLTCLSCFEHDFVRVSRRRKAHDPTHQKSDPGAGENFRGQGGALAIVLNKYFCCFFIHSTEKSSSSSSSSSSISSSRSSSSSSGSSSSNQWSLLLGSMITWVEVLTYPVVIIT